MLALSPAKRRVTALLALAVAGLALALAGCSNSSAPNATPTVNPLGGTKLSGDLSPAQGTFVLKRLDEAPPGRAPILVDLVGSNLQVDAANEDVSIDVALRNAGGQALYAPAMVWVFAPRPAGVTVLNADVVPVPPDTSVTNPPPPDRYGFDYTLLLGGDNVLEAGETSVVKTWTFHVPGLTGFTFGARAEFGMVPDLPAISGRAFYDLNQNGLADAGEGPVPGMIGVSGPDSLSVTVMTDRQGQYAVPVTSAGLYTLLYRPRVVRPGTGARLDDPPPPDTQPIYTTPNPLHVTLLPGPGGRPAGFANADFGVVLNTAPPDTSRPDSLRSILPWPAGADSLVSGPWHFVEGGVRGLVLRLKAGYSGCQPDHPFALYWRVGPQASPLPHVELRLTYDALSEPCARYMTRNLRFDLQPIRTAVGGTGPIFLHLVSPDGVMHNFVLGDMPPD